MQERMNKQGRAYIAGLAATAESLWALACKGATIGYPGDF